MQILNRLACCWLLSCSLLAGGHAAEAVAVAAPASALVPFASEEGLARLARSTARADFPALANQFEAQSNAAFCGPTTAAIVLNTIRARSPELPRDRTRLSAEDLRFVPGGFDLTVPRYTQENVITKGQKTRAQVLGEPVLVNGKPINDFGYQTRQLDEMLRANGVLTQLVIVNDTKPEADIRADLEHSLADHDSYAIVTYKRAAVGQQGGGHISPLGAFDAASDSFLVMDVNPASAGWVWMPATLLIKGMRTFDTVENRGYILLRAP